ncbi:response regulator [Exiguobacterium profundum]|uniref:response regulator transcription factor n=1 Tax=Exiguobacterium TaxID=33986 RepID=UPI00093ED373|nr:MULTISPECIES: response regulator [Exiguobacterium]QPI67168.1 response regulator [Exiguobacterium sp. PBE]MCT4798897.1 response regulator [Exiguobacterium profundum]MCV9901057.1 response regulator [Exiguobacterium sp. N5]MDT0193319.1 response regulator [Exiguobacterium sp. BG5(2022)]VXB82097.1 Two component transcriptional regulator, AraC family [Exiguobacterium sp. 8A]
MTKVLIVDDESPVREAVKLLGEWERFGVKAVLEAKNGLEAKALIEQERPALILSDIQMPHCDGIELMEWVHDHASSSKLVVLTGYDEYSYMRRAIQYGSFDYLLKPIDPDVLNDTLSRALAGVMTESSEDPIAQIGTYIEQHFAEELSLQGMSERFYLSREYISRRFKQQYGVNLSEYVLTIRMNEAKRLLETSRQRIYEVAQAVGFSDDKYFRKVFKKQVGVTPNEFREQVQRQA